jgi:hypothetical protein
MPQSSCRRTRAPHPLLTVRVAVHSGEVMRRLAVNRDLGRRAQLIG